jgi:hypothetical protein
MTFCGIDFSRRRENLLLRLTHTGEIDTDITEREKFFAVICARKHAKR